MKSSLKEIITCLILTCFFPCVAWATKINCKEFEIKYYGQADRLMQEIEVVELCARPAEGFRDKVFSNLKYRANRLNTCVQMVKQGKLGFDCSREFRKTMKADGGENCAKELERMRKSFKKFETLFSRFKPCLEK